ncbi:MAG: Rpn family recombination-promoting nuclease/putative transposase [Treponema sp.]|nr:Rpn family recombination-promoting nuclease/putative transposase [Treponema sp.]
MSELKKSPAWEDLTFANNFLFCKILENDPELCRQILEMLLDIEIEKLEPVQAERTMLETMDSKSVRFDVYAKDGNRIFDIEMQTTASKNLPKRARYYQSVIDMDSLSQGEKYSRLKDSYVIFLCLSSPFKENLPMYFFENTCRSNPKIKLNDRTFKLFFNASEYAKMEKDEVKCFFKFLAKQRAESGLTKSIEEKVNFAKKDMTWRKEYMTWQQTIDEEKEIAFEEGKEEGREEGIERGKSEKAIEDAENFLREGIAAEIISRCTGVSLKQVMQIKDRIINEGCVVQS